MITMNNVSKTIGDFKLENITFEFPKGYILGMIGPNGAGKTTLINLILHLYFPGEGDLLVDGKKYEDAEEEIKNEIGYVLNEDLFLQDSSLLENADLYGKYYQKYDRERFCSYCKEFKLEENRKLGKCSKGEKLKFQFAFALSHEPKLLILDEPTANFDPEFRDSFLRIITEFVADGEHSVILATHLTTDLDRLADYILFLNKGKQLYFSDRESLLDSFRIVSGEAYQVKLLPEERIVYQESGAYGVRALVKHKKLNHYHSGLEVRRPNIEELMYYTICAEKRGPRKSNQ